MTRKESSTFGRTNNALNFEKTRNISFAFRAVPRRSLSLAMIWFSTLETRSLYAFSAVTQISVPSAQIVNNEVKHQAASLTY